MFRSKTKRASVRRSMSRLSRRASDALASSGAAAASALAVLAPSISVLASTSASTSASASASASAAARGRGPGAGASTAGWEEDRLSNELVRYRGMSISYLLQLKADLLRGDYAEGTRLVTLRWDLRRTPAGKKGDTVLLTDSSRPLWRGQLGSGADRSGDARLEFFEEDVLDKPREDWTVEDVCEFVVLPATRDGAYIYTDLVDPEHVGAPFEGAFVSLARKTSFAALVDGLAAHFSAQGLPAERTFVWLDLFGANQPLLTRRDDSADVRREREELLSKVLHEAISKFDTRVVFFDSWVEPTPLQRAWCIWEIYGAVKSERSLELVFPPGEDAHFVQALREDYYAVLGQLLQLDMREAQCHDPRDKERIMHAVETTVEGGFVRLIETILAQLRSWLLHSTRRAVAAEQARVAQPPLCDDADVMLPFARLVFQAGKLLIDQAQYEDAQTYLDLCLRIVERFRGPRHVDVAEILVEGIGEILQLGDEHALALQHYERALLIIRAWDTAVEPDARAAGRERERRLALALESVASVHLQRGDFADALETFRDARRRLEAAFGPSYFGLARVYNGEAQVLLLQGDLAGAQRSADRAFAVVSARLRQRHPTRAEVLKTLAAIRGRAGDHESALRLLHEARQIATETLDGNHPTLANILNEMGLEANSLGLYTDALNLLQRAISIHESRGDRHLAYARVRHNVGVVLASYGKPEDALACYEESVGIKLDVLGEWHTSVADTYENMAVCQNELRRFAAAVEFLERALRIRERVLGKQHEVTRRTLVRVNIYRSAAAAAARRR